MNECEILMPVLLEAFLLLRQAKTCTRESGVSGSEVWHQHTTVILTAFGSISLQCCEKIGKGRAS